MIDDNSCNITFSLDILYNLLSLHIGHICIFYNNSIFAYCMMVRNYIYHIDGILLENFLYTILHHH